MFLRKRSGGNISTSFKNDEKINQYVLSRYLCKVRVKFSRTNSKLRKFHLADRLHVFINKHSCLVQQLLDFCGENGQRTGEKSSHTFAGECFCNGFAQPVVFALQHAIFLRF